jgi:hypothetical protein
MADPRKIEQAGETWDAQVLRSLPSGVDVTILEERVMLTPTERLERMISVLRLIEAARHRT